MEKMKLAVMTFLKVLWMEFDMVCPKESAKIPPRKGSHCRGPCFKVQPQSWSLCLLLPVLANSALLPPMESPYAVESLVQTQRGSGAVEGS